MSDEAIDTVAAWLGQRPQREVVVSTLFASLIIPLTTEALQTSKDVAESLRGGVETATHWADYIIKYCKEHPPA